jgi:hypothetical protein
MFKERKVGKTDDTIYVFCLSFLSLLQSSNGANMAATLGGDERMRLTTVAAAELAPSPWPHVPPSRVMSDERRCASAPPQRASPYADAPPR